MTKGVEHIGQKDIIWSYTSVIFTVGAGLLLLPFILNKMSAETVGVWNIFQAITALVAILDMGFRPTFARNISYILSGVKELQVEGVKQVEGNGTIDYSLLKGLLVAMKHFYRWVALGVFIILATAGTAYFAYILKKYSGDRVDAMIAWLILIAINCYNLYTFYYDALVTGKGYITRMQQITIIGQFIYLSIAIGLIYMGLGLSAIVSAQLLQTIVRRVLMYHVFFTKDMRSSLSQVEAQEPRQLMRAIYPNALKIGLTQVGGFAVNKSAVFFGSAFLTLPEVACYGVTLQVMEVLCHLAHVPVQSYTPKMAQARAERDTMSLRRYYILNAVSLITVFGIGGLLWVLAGDWALTIIHSETQFVPMGMLIAMLCIHFLEDNHSTSANFIMADNKIPFWIPSLLSGGGTILLLWLFLGPCHMGLWGMILAPGIAQLVYQNWKWPSVVIKELWFQSQ